MQKKRWQQNVPQRACEMKTNRGFYGQACQPFIPAGPFPGHGTLANVFKFSGP